MIKPSYRNWLWKFTLAIFAFTSLINISQAADAISDPQAEIETTFNKLIKKLQENSGTIKEDQSIAYKISEELITPYIDFKRITRLVVGKHWRQADEAQREQLYKEVKSLLVRSYVTAMASYSDQIVAQKDQIKYKPSRFKPGDKKATVRSSVTLSGGKNADVQYKMLYAKDIWKIYDIRIEGVSLAITYRTTFGDSIKEKGLEGLIAQLTDQNQKGHVELPAKVANQ